MSYKIINVKLIRKVTNNEPYKPNMYILSSMPYVLIKTHLACISTFRHLLRQNLNLFCNNYISLLIKGYV